jgi:hypothetical protein
MSTHLDDAEARTKIRSGLDLLFRKGDSIEMRVFRDRDKKYSANVSGFFNDLDKLAQAIYAINKRGRTIFVTMNPLKVTWQAVNNKAYIGSAPLRQELEKAGLPLEPRMKASKDWETGQIHHAMRMSDDGDTLARRWILVDIDAGQPPETNSSDVEHANTRAMADAILEFFAEHSFPPCGLTNSGNGHHVYIRLNALENTPENLYLVQRFLLALAQRFDGKFGTAALDISVFNSSRVTKCPGSMVFKGTDTTERPCRRSEVLQVASLRFTTVEQIKEIADEYVGKINAWSGQGADAIEDVELKAKVEKLKEFLTFHEIEFGNISLVGEHVVIPVTCPNIAQHTCDTGEMQTVATVRVSGQFGFNCLHAHCQKLHGWAGLKAFVEARDGRKFSFDPGVTF